jgi:hypothetical protein
MKQTFDRKVIIVLIVAAIGACVGVLVEPYGTVCMDIPLYCFEPGSKGSIFGSALVFAGLGGILAVHLLYRSTSQKE